MPNGKGGCFPAASFLFARQGLSGISSLCQAVALPGFPSDAVSVQTSLRRSTTEGSSVPLLRHAVAQRSGSGASFQRLPGALSTRIRHSCREGFSLPFSFSLFVHARSHHQPSSPPLAISFPCFRALPSELEHPQQPLGFHAYSKNLFLQKMKKCIGYAG